jgi:multimeric flavodoxin WrbA
MSRVVILVGSVRKNGNTEVLANSFAEGAKLKNDVQIISVADYNINPCAGCNSCAKRENHRCFQNDDMDKIYDELLSADVLVIASPVYFYSLSAQLKAVIDRLHTPLRNDFKVKKLGLLLVAGASLPSVFDSILVQYQLVLDYFKLESIGSVLVRDVRHMGDIVGNKVLEDAFLLGKSI